MEEEEYGVESVGTNAAVATAAAPRCCHRSTTTAKMDMETLGKLAREFMDEDDDDVRNVNNSGIILMMIIFCYTVSLPVNK